MLSKRLLALFLFTTFLFSTAAHSIGRIGNNTLIGDAQDGYKAQLPVAFQEVATVSDGGLILASGRFASSPAIPVDIQILPFRTQYPLLRGQGAAVMEAYFRDTPGIRYEKLSVRNSSLSLFGETDSSYVGISVCGDGRGYVLFGPRFAMTREGILAILLQTEFEVPCQN